MFIKRLFIALIIITSAISSVSQVVAVNHEIPRSLRLSDEIVRNGQYIITDFDGTIAGMYNGRYEPGLDESPCYQPLLDWLRSGGRVVVITGNALTRTMERLFKHIPNNLRTNNQVMIVANGGSAFYGTDAEGNVIEDIDYRERGLNGETTVIAEEYIAPLIDDAKKTLNAFFSQLRDDPQFRKQLPKKYAFLLEIAKNKKGEYTTEELLTHDISVVPRIETRCIVDADLQPNPKLVTQISLIGIPVQIEYPMEGMLQKAQDGKLSGFEIVRMNLTTDINRKGMDKAIPIFWMVSSPAYDFIPERSLAMGDRPNGNDGPMMRLHDKLNMPFVSVSELVEILPIGVHNIGGNCEGSAKLLRGLVSKAQQLEKGRDLVPVIPAKLNEVIGEILEENGR